MSNNTRGLVRSMTIIGGAQAANILLSIFRMKVLAVLLGPAGIGLLSLFQSLLDASKTAAGLGLNASGVRQIANARDDLVVQGQVRLVLIAAHWVQGIVAMAALWLLREPVSVWLFDSSEYALEVGLIGAAVLFSLIGLALLTVLQGLRQIADFGRVTVFGALAGTVAGLFAVWIWGEAGLIWFVIVQPAAIMLVAWFYTSRLPALPTAAFQVHGVWGVWKPMASLGMAFMLGALASTATLLFARSFVTQELGLVAAGHFAAAWGITMTYVGFLLAAMSADYFPRLAEVIDDREAATGLMNDQLQLGLAIGGPVLLALIGLAPWAIKLLYSSEFSPAVTLLQWQTAGNVFKLGSWPLAFWLIAAARSKLFLLTELSFNIVFVVAIWFFLPLFGLVITAIGFLAGYLVYFTLVNSLVRQTQGFRWEGASLVLLAMHSGLAIALLALAQIAPLTTVAASIVLAGLTGVFGARMVLVKIGPEGRLAGAAFQLYRKIGWPIRSEA